jgi:hypothetical protein
MNDWTEDNGDTYCKREKESARVRFCDAWSFNLSERDINRYKSLKYVTEKATYIISVEKALEKGFKRPTAAGETKLFIPIKNWEVLSAV